MSTQSGSIKAVENPGFIRKFYLKYSKWTRKVGFAVADQVFFAGTNFVINVMLARWLPPEQYGAFIVAYSWFLLPQNLYEAVLVDPLTIFGAGKYSKKFREYLGYVYYGHFMVSLVVAAMLGAGAIFTYVFKSEILGIALAGAALSAPFQFTRYLSRRPFYVLSKPEWSAIGGVFYLIFSVIGLGALHLFDLSNHPVSSCIPANTLFRCSKFYAPQVLTPFSALMVMGIAGIIASGILTIFLLKPKFGVSDETLNTKTVLADHWEYGKWSFGSRILTWLPTNSYLILLPLFGVLSDSGTLSALTYLVTPLNMSLTAVAAILLPNFVRSFNNHGRWSLNHRVSLIMQFFIAGTGLYFLFIVFFGKLAVHHLYGGAYDEYVTYPILIAMGLVPIVNSISTVIRAALQASGQVKRTFTARIIPTISTMTFGVFLLANFGVLGANLSSLFSSTLALLILMRVYRKHIASVEDPVMIRKRTAAEAEAAAAATAEATTATSADT